MEKTILNFHFDYLNPSLMSPNLGTDDVTKTDEFSKKVKKGEGRGGINLNLSRKKWNVIFGK